MPTNKIGIANLSETTSLLTKDALQKAHGFLPDEASVFVRPGYHVKTFIGTATDTILPIATAGVSLSGEPFIFIVGANGYLYACPINRLGHFYVVARRHFKYQENIFLFNRDDYFTGNSGSSLPTQNTAWMAKIITVGKSVYILSNERSWLIQGDGIVMFDETTKTLIVDALEATIHDIENETPQLQQIGRDSSVLMKDDSIYVRAKSELGGYGAPSNDVIIPETNAYIVHGIKGMTNQLSISKLNVVIP